MNFINCSNTPCEKREKQLCAFDTMEKFESYVQEKVKVHSKLQQGLEQILAECAFKKQIENDFYEEKAKLESKAQQLILEGTEKNIKKLQNIYKQVEVVEKKIKPLQQSLDFTKNFIETLKETVRESQTEVTDLQNLLTLVRMKQNVFQSVNEYIELNKQITVEKSRIKNFLSNLIEESKKYESNLLKVFKEKDNENSNEPLEEKSYSKFINSLR